MKNLILIALLTFGLGNASAQSPQEFQPGFSTGSGKFMTGAKAKRYFDKLVKQKYPNGETVGPAKDSKACPGVQYIRDYTMPIGLKDKIAYALHTRYFGGRCVVDCHDFGAPVPVGCIHFTRADGNDEYQCVMMLGAWGTSEKFTEQPAVKKLISCTDTDYLY